MAASILKKTEVTFQTPFFRNQLFIQIASDYFKESLLLATSF